MSIDSNNPNGFGGFGQPFPGPEDLGFVGRSVRYVLVGGVPVLVSGECPVVDPVTGEIVSVEVSGSILHDDCGVPFPAETFLGVSWSGLKVFGASARVCVSPFKLHPFPRLCRVDSDGFYSEPDERAVGGGHNFLCSECLERNSVLVRRRNWLWWLGVLPDIY